MHLLSETSSVLLDAQKALTERIDNRVVKEKEATDALGGNIVETAELMRVNQSELSANLEMLRSGLETILEKLSGDTAEHEEGPVKIVGTSDKPVVFCGLDSVVNWNGFHIMSSAVPFEIKNLVVENAFRNTVFRSRGSFENVRFLNNYYGLWVDESPDVSLVRCLMSHNRYALSVRAGRVVSTETNISENVYGLYLETEGKVDGDTDLIRNNRKVRPCAYMMEEAGDVHDTPFDEIWANADVFKKLRTKAYAGACGKCKFNDRCGGCRARAAYYHDGDYMQEDSYCAYGRGL